MRRIALVVLLAVLPLAFAPAPPPKRDRETPTQKRQRLLNERARRLDELGVKWQVLTDGGWTRVRFSVEHPSRNGNCMGGTFAADDLLATLQFLVRRVEAFFRDPDFGQR